MRVIDMQPYKDPDEFIKGLSAEEFQNRIQSAQNSFFYEIGILQREYDMGDPEEKTKFMNEAAKKCLTFENEIERNNYIEAFSREYGIRSEDFRQLVKHYAAAAVGIQYEKIKSERQKKKESGKEDGIGQIQAILLTWISEDLSLYPIVKETILPEDFLDEPYREVAKLLYEQAETGSMSPATIISRFDSKEEQSVVAGLFNRQVKEVREHVEREKALNEVVKTLKKASLEKQSREITDLSQLQALIAEKKKLEHLSLRLPAQ